MLKALIIIAGATVLFCLGLIACSVGLNAWGTISGAYDYPLQMEILRWAFGILGGSTTVLSLGGLAQIRKAEADKAELEHAWLDEREITVPPGKQFIKPEDVPKAIQSIETVAISAEKFDVRTERINPAKPTTPFNGEISIIPGEVLIPQSERLHEAEDKIHENDS